METFNFKLFEQGPIERTNDRIYVTIDPRCRIFFNRQAHEALGSPLGVALMYDERQKVIGVLPSAIGRKETYRLRTNHKGSTGKAIPALNFCRAFDIAPTEALAFQNPRVNNHGVLILNLHQVQPITRREPKRPKTN
jgi:hypothetical protein